jgi:hypothetical protein
VFQEVGGVAVHRAGAGCLQVRARDPAGQDRDGDHAVPYGGFHVPDGVADEHGSFARYAGEFPGLCDGVRGGFAVGDVVRTG